MTKYAVKLGGGINHRFNLSDEFLIKDNHIASSDIDKLVIRAIKKGKKIKGKMEKGKKGKREKGKKEKREKEKRRKREKGKRENKEKKGKRKKQKNRRKKNRKREKEDTRGQGGVSSSISRTFLELRSSSICFELTVFTYKPQIIMLSPHMLIKVMLGI